MSQVRLDHLVAQGDLQLSQFPQNLNEEQYAEYRTDWEHDVYMALNALATLQKSPGFSGEQEVRLIVSFVDGSPHQHFRATNYGVVRYCKLVPTNNPTRTGLVQEMCGKFISEAKLTRSVGVGPLLDFRNNEATITALLQQHGVENANVWRSEVPLR